MAYGLLGLLVLIYFIISLQSAYGCIYGIEIIKLCTTRGSLYQIPTFEQSVYNIPPVPMATKRNARTTPIEF